MAQATVRSPALELSQGIGQKKSSGRGRNLSQASTMRPGLQEPAAVQESAALANQSGGAAGKPNTTICFRNVPNCYDGKKILELLNSTGFFSKYDFIYVPHDFKRLPALVNLGYFFVNFVSHHEAMDAWAKLDGFKEWSMESAKVLNATWATQTQGFKACVKRYKNCPVLHKAVPDECKPMVFDNGILEPLRSTKRNIKQPPTVFGRGDVKKHIVEEREEKFDEECDGSVSTEPPHELEVVEADQESQGDSFVEEESLADGFLDAGNICLDKKSKNHCSKCTEPFTMTRWRHYCRACALICCAECAPRAGLGSTHRLKRVCKDCVLEPQTIKITHHVKNGFIDDKALSYNSYPSSY